MTPPPEQVGVAARGPVVVLTVYREDGSVAAVLELDREAAARLAVLLLRAVAEVRS